MVVSRPVAVVGATGVLRPAAERLVERGVRVVGVARTIAALEAMRGALGDLFSPHPADTTAGCPELPLRLAGALAYGPAVGGRTVAALREATDGTVVLVLTSAAARPGREEWSVTDLPPMPGVRRLVLGWTASGRWHDATAISEAALDLLGADSDEDRVLGVVRPWAGRPT